MYVQRLYVAVFRATILFAAFALITTVIAGVPYAATGEVKSHQKISDTQGGFTGTLDDLDQLGISQTSLGDLDGDGTVDLAVGANSDDDAGTRRGPISVLYLNSDCTVKSHQKS